MDESAGRPGAGDGILEEWASQGAQSAERVCGRSTPRAAERLWIQLEEAFASLLLSRWAGGRTEGPVPLHPTGSRHPTALKPLFQNRLYRWLTAQPKEGYCPLPLYESD